MARQFRRIVQIVLAVAAVWPYLYSHMKTTIELPDAILERTKVAAARRRTSMKNLVIQGLEMVLQDEVTPASPTEALARLRGGYHLGGHPMTREEMHAR
jgi:hypothetical protein